MPFQLAEDERLIQETIRSFANQLGLEGAQDRDRHDRYPTEAMQQAAGLGLLGVMDPRNGLNATHLVLALDAVACVDPALAACVAGHNAALATLAASNHPAAAAVGQGEVASLLVAEEATGSDITRLGARLRQTDKGLRLTGQKVWGLNAAGASHFVVAAQGPNGPCLVHVAANSAGVALGANDPVMGLRSAGMRTVYFSDVAVAPEDVLAASDVPALLAQAVQVLRLGAAAALCGAVGGGLEAAAAFAQSRVQFQNAIGTYQAVSDGVTEMDIQLQAARALCLQAAANQAGPDAGVWAARAKAFAAGMAVPMTRQAIRIQGGTGFMREGGTERFARDARALQFMGDSGPLQRDVLKRHLLPGITYPADA